AVRAAAGRGLQEFHTHLPTQLARVAEEMDGPNAFHRRTVDPAADFQARFGMNRLQSTNLPLDHVLILPVRDAHVEGRPGTLRNDVGACASLDQADAHREALVRTRKLLNPQELTGELGDGVHARSRVDAGVGSPAVN